MRSTGKPRCFTPSFRLLAITQLIDCAAANLNLCVCSLRYLFGILFSRQARLLNHMQSMHPAKFPANLVLHPAPLRALQARRDARPWARPGAAA